MGSKLIKSVSRGRKLLVEREVLTFMSVFAKGGQVGEIEAGGLSQAWARGHSSRGQHSWDVCGSRISNQNAIHENKEPCCRRARVCAKLEEVWTWGGHSVQEMQL